MGAGSSISGLPAVVDKSTAKELMGDRFDEVAFDRLASELGLASVQRYLCDEMFDLCDQDQDGFLNTKDANYLAFAISGGSLSEADWMGACAKLGNQSGKMTKDEFWRAYSKLGLFDINEDHPKLMKYRLRRMCDHIFDVFDQDSDGLLNATDGNYLCKATSGGSLSEADWMGMCAQLGNQSGKMSKDDLWCCYTELKIGDVEKDHKKIATLDMAAFKAAQEEQKAQSPEKAAPGPPAPAAESAQQRLRRLCDELFIMSDQDKDGFLNYDDIAYVVRVTSGGNLPQADWAGICKQVKCAMGTNMSKDEFWRFYTEINTDISNLEKDHQMMAALKPAAAATGGGDGSGAAESTFAADSAPAGADFDFSDFKREEEEKEQQRLRCLSDELFDICDQDKDGLLGYLPDAIYLVRATSGNSLSEADWAGICAQVGNQSGKMTKDEFWRRYSELKIGNVDVDHTKATEATARSLWKPPPPADGQGRPWTVTIHGKQVGLAVWA